MELKILHLIFCATHIIQEIHWLAFNGVIIFLKLFSIFSVGLVFVIAIFN